MSAYDQTNEQGQIVDIADATPILQIDVLPAAVAVTSGSPVAKSVKFVLDESQYYGLGTNSETNIGAVLRVDADQAFDITIIKNGSPASTKSVSAGTTFINFQDFASAIDVDFGDEFEIQVTHLAADGQIEANTTKIYFYQDSSAA